MKRLILGLVVALLFAAAGRAETNVVTFDFNSGLGPNFSAFDRADGLLAVDTDGPSVRISKPADDGTVRPTDGINAGIRSDFSVHGDFTITADFALNDFPPADDKEINASSMTVLAENGDTLSVLRLRVGDSNFVEMMESRSGPREQRVRP